MWTPISGKALSSSLKRQASLALMATSLLGGMAITSSAQSAMLDLTPSSTSLTVGDTLTVGFAISGLSGSAGDSLSAFDLDVMFDDSILAFTGASFDDPALGNQLDFTEATSFGFAGDATDMGGGLLDAYGLSGNSDAVLDSQQADSFQFLSLDFTVLSATASSSVAIDLSDPLLMFLDSLYSDLSMSYLAQEITFSATDGSTNVPTPGTLLVFSTGLLLLGASKKRRQA